MSMTSNRPYLIRAFYDWIVDNDCTPYVVVDAYFDGVEVPQQHVNDGQIVLNLSPRAIAGFSLENQQIQFSTRFGGVPTDIRLPVESILGIYARENGQGMVFQREEPAVALAPVQGGAGDDDDTPPPAGPGGSRPTLRVVK
ncbi:ClpXP protease specificity-enhancing factor [bacterium SCSIO 12696]|nr:ClpXP protease specificity-enhancing factor [bacterium SCSIO 12696]